MERKIIPDKLAEYIKTHPDATQRQIATHFNCSYIAVAHALRRYKIPYKIKSRYGKPPLSEEDLRKYIRENPGATQEQIAAHFDRDQSSVSTAIKRGRIPYIKKI